MPKLLCENVELFNVKLEEAKVLANGNPIIILLTGAIDPSTGLSWCPDCTNADPVIHDIVITQNPNVVLLTCPVRREDFRKPDYEFRTNEVKLKCVPTVSTFVQSFSIYFLLHVIHMFSHLPRESYI
jgi:hypothetical protein